MSPPFSLHSILGSFHATLTMYVAGKLPAYMVSIPIYPITQQRPIICCMGQYRRLAIPVMQSNKRVLCNICFLQWVPVGDGCQCMACIRGICKTEEAC